ncbi:MAG: hypothetical protein KF746_04370 [Chitinophagaceae bacterium]|nr:hypothetical protein [Chitinophagaceae bacterium]
MLFNDANPDPVFNNNATFNWNSGEIYFFGATFNNNSGAAMAANGNNSLANWTGTNIFNNNGTFTKQNGTGITTITVPSQNSALTNTGKFNIAAGTALVNNNTFNYNTGSQLSGNGVLRNNNTFILNTALNLAATITLDQTGGEIRGGNLLTISGTVNWSSGNLNTGLTNNGTFNLTNNISIMDTVYG